MRMRLCLLASIALAGSAAAQTSAPPQEPEIVVTAQRPPEEEVRAFVDALTAPAGEQQLARFETRAVCPMMIGASAEQEKIVTDRMRQVATAAKVPLAGEKCRANVLLIVVADKAAFLRILERRHGYLFGTLNRFQVRALVTDSGPVAGWQVAGPDLNADGVEIPVDFNGIQVNQTTRGGSRLTSAARPHVAGAIVVVESGALDGLTLRQLADYTAMRAFAQIDVARLRGSPVPTILKAIDAPMGSTVPNTLTAWDLGVLRGLYSAPVNLRAAAQRSAVRRRVTEETGSR